MRIYYRGPDVVVTSELFVVRRGSPPGRFAIHDLRDVCIAPGRPDGVRLSIVAPPAAVAALVAAAAVSAAGGVLVGVAIAVSAAGAGMVCAVVQQHRPRRWELRATYRDCPVRLYASTDARVFHQVSRALRRAIENDQRPYAGEAAAA
ncbi:DUF6232 family protein [Actinoplanes subtropicus]|uniref:DUF6232 family protein n=1 Tax=Actinoplanes subtropicus TaxID=543632 RepID=UPI0004C43DB0|nr:DUF6232 family protein [Actinoplanes subtropicus]